MDGVYDGAFGGVFPEKLLPVSIYLKVEAYNPWSIYIVSASQTYFFFLFLICSLHSVCVCSLLRSHI